MTDPDTTAAVAAARHTPANVEPDGTPLDWTICTWCDESWPCDAHVLAQEIERLRSAARALLAAYDDNGDDPRADHEWTCCVNELRELLTDTHPATAGRGSED